MQKARPARSGRTFLSWGLFALSAALFIAVAATWYQDRDKEAGEPLPPTSVPGENEAIHVKQALEAEGLKVTFSPGGGRSDELSVAGQLFDVDGEQLYVFIYPQGTVQREEETTGVDLGTMTIVNTRGTPVSSEPPDVFVGSNVVGVLYGISDEVSSKVQAAIEGLP